MWLFADVGLRGAALDQTFLRAGKQFLLFVEISQVGDAAHVFSVILGTRCAIVDSVVEQLGKAASSGRSGSFRVYKIQARDGARADNQVFPEDRIRAGIVEYPITVAVNRSIEIVARILKVWYQITVTVTVGIRRNYQGIALWGYCGSRRGPDQRRQNECGSEHDQLIYRQKPPKFVRTHKNPPSKMCLERSAYTATIIPVCLDGFGAIITSICCGFGLIRFPYLIRSTDALAFDCSSDDRVQATHFYRAAWKFVKQQKTCASIAGRSWHVYLWLAGISERQRIQLIDAAV
jgi:hypothetical protein